jgi:hypothetical protein
LVVDKSTAAKKMAEGHTRLRPGRWGKAAEKAAFPFLRFRQFAAGWRDPNFV